MSSALSRNESPALTSTRLRGQGFQGFTSFSDLMSQRWQQVPSEPGVYVVVTLDPLVPLFLEKSSGGHFKGSNPSVDVSTLRTKWLDGADLLYVGQSVDLRRRVKELTLFGMGQPVGHRGGRYLWQLANRDSLRVAWRASSSGPPRDAEKELLEAFKSANNGSLPFGNLVG